MEEHSVSIAVMPFRNLSSEPDTEFFSNGFVEDLIAELTRFRSLRVLASQSTFALSEAGRSVDEVVREWDLQYILEGSVRRSRSTIRVSAQLIRVNGGQTVWAERYDAALDQVFSIQDEIVATVAGNLAVKIDDVELARAQRRSIDQLPAYDCWLRGMHHLKRGTLEADEESRSLFQQALQIDSHYARTPGFRSLISMSGPVRRGTYGTRARGTHSIARPKRWTWTILTRWYTPFSREFIVSDINTSRPTGTLRARWL